MKVLVFQHVPHEHLGLIADFANTHKIEIDIIELWKPYNIPSIFIYDALIIMGGPMGVYEGKEAFPSKKDEVVAIKRILGEIPVLGFCLGAQILAYALGAKVYPNIKAGKKVKEIGFYDIALTQEGLQSHLFAGFTSPVSVLQWHGDTFDLPQNSHLLATSELCRNQAFAYKNAYGLQFHFEFTPEMIEKQIEVDRKWIHEDFTIDEDTLIQKAKANEKLMEEQSNLLLSNFFSQVN